ncbi:MAG: tRNA-dihydrouridine synthase [Candidatus Staskawiczbacteria bacterium]|nr:tRNA-dihydrouridine synthase [Candidatus Staskawiczbacteria bacterium]
MIQLGFWGKLKKPIMALAPMSGVTDEAFRLMFLKYGQPDVFWTEFVSAEGLFSRGRKFCLKILEHSPKEKPIVAQLFGATFADFERSAKLMAELGFDGIDINMGCPDINIEKKGGGAALIKNFQLAKEIIRATKKGAGKLPVSVKTRIGYNKIQVKEWIGVILEEEPAVITVHFRTRDELYFSKAHWELAREIVELRNKISPKTLLLGNGDVKSLEEAKKLAEEKGLDGIMVGRAVVGDPWFFGGKVPSVTEKLKAIVEHAKIFDKCHKEERKEKNYHKKFASIKKHFHAYAKDFRGAKELRDELMKVKNTAETKAVIEKFLK